MTAAALTLPELARMMRELIRDRSYQRETRLGGAVAEYLAWARLRLAPRSLEIYEGYQARLCLLLADRDPAIDEVTVEMLLEGFKEHEAPSFAIVRTSYSNLFTWARLTGLRADNPVELLPRMRPKNTKVYEVFTPAEQQQILMATDRMLLPWIQRLRALTLIDLGVRKEEARLMRFEHFDMVNKAVVVNGKGDKDRVVPVSDELWRALVAARNRPLPKIRTADGFTSRPLGDDDFLFFPYGAKGSQLLWTDPTRPLSQRGMHARWETLIDTAGVKYRSMHMARHTLGTELAMADEDLASIQDWLGHADPKVTKMYVHNSRSRLQRARARLDEYRKAQG